MIPYPYFYSKNVADNTIDTQKVSAIKYWRYSICIDINKLVSVTYKPNYLYRC